MKKVLVCLALTLFAVSLFAQAPAVPDKDSKWSVSLGFSYAQYGQPGGTESIFVGSTDYKLGGYLAGVYHFTPSWGMALVASASADRIMLKDPYLDPAKAALEAKGLSYAALTLEGRYYWRSMYFSLGPTFTKFKMDGGPDNKKIGVSAGIGGEFPLTKTVYIYAAASYTFIPDVEIVPGAKKNMSGVQSQFGVGFRF